MKIERKMKICFCAIIALVLSCFAFLFMGETNENINAFAAETAYEEIYVGDVVVAEEHTLSVGGASVKAEGFTVTYPSGGVYTGKSFAAEQAGWYEVTYFATVSGERVEETQSYLALRKPKDIIVSTNGATVSYGKYEVDSPYEIKNEIYGGIVNFQAGQSVTFTANIKTENLTKDYNVIDMIVIPSVFKETDFERLTVKITDADNPDNYVEIVINSSNTLDGDGQVSYIRAGANGQQIGGYEGSTFHTVNYGAQIEHSFRGLGHVGESRKDITVSEFSVSIAIDNAERRIYCGPKSNLDAEKVMVNDLDDVANYKGNPWGGFTSEEVTVQVTASNFSKSTGKLLIKSYGDYDFSKDIADEVAPSIVLDYDETAAQPVAVLNQSFPIIPFTAKDNLDKQLKTDVSVYYLAEDGKKINVDCDGESFFVKYMGNYEVVYTAEDLSGNKTQVTKEISVMDHVPEIFISLDEPEISAQAYQTVYIPQASQVSLFGGSGKLAVERTVYSPSKEVLDVKDSLLLTELGEYKVVYKVTDYLDSVQYGVITVSSMETDGPVFVEYPTFEKILFKGFTYELPQAFVIETVDGKIVSLPCNVYVNGELVDGSFTLSGEETEAEIKYVVDGETGSNEWSTVIPVVDTGDGRDKDEYFYIENGVEILYEKKYLQFSFANDGKVEFVKELYSNEFIAGLSYEGEWLNFSKMTITLVDAKDQNLSVSLHFYYDKGDNSWFIQQNGQKEKVEYTTSGGDLNFALSKDGSRIIDASGEAVATIVAYDNGEPFEGFSDALYFGLSFEGVYSESKINLRRLCNQSMGHERSSKEFAEDDTNPVITLDGEFVVYQKLGKKANIPTAYANDVLGQVVEFTVTIETNNGKLLAKGPASKPLDIVMNEAGRYLVTYYAEDSVGNSASLPYVMIVRDETAPSLTIKNTLKKEYTLGSNVAIPTCSAKDNDKNCYIQVMLILPNNEMRLLQYIENGKVTSMLNKDNELYNDSFKVDSNTFKVESKGKYVLRVLAYDEYYNYTVHEIEFMVK
ncbi:MAG: hypothetical protein IJF44_01280 [Clostridia bacterium]|nr:hypothetical protein [Clostridia bacterium]